MQQIRAHKERGSLIDWETKEGKGEGRETLFGRFLST